MAFLDKYQRQFRENDPVVYEDLTFYPLLVRDYHLYLMAKPAFELMQSSLLKPALARMPWCACLWELDKECKKQTGEYGLFLTEVMLVLSKALRLDAYENGDIPLRPVYSQSGELTAIMLGDPRVNPTLLDMRQMSEVRQIIAGQNGYDIPDESWNPELVQAAQENARRNNACIEYDFEALVYSVAVNASCRPKEIYDWTIREFHQTQEAIDRKLNYLIFNLAEKSGNVTFKQGNPYPSWRFNSKSELPTGFRSIADIDQSSQGLIAGT